MREKILSLLEKDGCLSNADIAAAIGAAEAAVAATIIEMREEKIICGNSTIINWEKVGREIVTAFIEVRVTPQRGDGFDLIAERIYRNPEVKSVFLMSGMYDLVVIVEAKSIKEVSLFVSDKLARINSVVGTATHFVLKNYKDHGVIMEEPHDDNERIKVLP